MSLVSYHCHSLYSDGKAAVSDMVDAAGRAGLTEFALSDHYVMTPYEDTNAHLWSMPRNGNEIEDALGELETAAEDSPITIRYGVEADFFPETWRQVRTKLASLRLDIVIGSVHYVDDFPLDYSADAWVSLTQARIDELFRLYWQRIRELAECRTFDVVGHLDLPKKFGIQPKADLSAEIRKALDAIADHDMAIELNCAGWDKPCADAYPAEDLLRKACKRDIPVLLSADAHAPEEVVRHYDDGIARMRAAGYTTMLTFEKRERRHVPIP